MNDVPDEKFTGDPVVTPVAPNPSPLTAASVVRTDDNGELAATVAAAPNNAMIFIRDAKDEDALRVLLAESHKRCRYTIDKRIGPRSLWRVQAESKRP